MAGPASRVSRVVMTGPLASFADAYALELEQRRYTPLTSVVQLRQVARLSNWLAGAGRRRADRRACRGVPRLPARYRALPRSVVTSGPAVPAGCAGSGWGCSPPGTSAALARRRMRCWRRLSVTCSPSALWRLVRSALRASRARFLAGLSPRGLAEVTAAEVTQAVLRESAAVSVSATQNFVAGLRALLRFCVRRGA